jgi:RimJ/RimL family protein N-acetyltransferase
MRCNSDLVLHGKRVILVPYLEQHVPKYNAWMQSTHLQELTESEPLTIDEEYAMQASWRNDKDKLTFILIDKSLMAPALMHHDLNAQCGDVNLYLNLNDHESSSVAEIEVMVAEEGSRRKGIAKEALQIMMAYAVTDLKVTSFVAKILESNEPSIRLFESLGYGLVKRVPAFHEVHLERGTDDLPLSLLRGTY